MCTFDRWEDAIAAGYTTGPQIKYRGFIISPHDDSGPNARGYHYAMRVRPDDAILFGAECEDSRELQDRKFARTVSVRLKKEKNGIGELGCFADLFSPDDWANGVDAAKAAINRWLSSSLWAFDALASYELWRAETDARQAAKQAARQSRRAASAEMTRHSQDRT